MGFGVATVVFVDAEGVDYAGYGGDEAHGEEDHIGFVGLLSSGDFLHLAVFELDVDGFEAGEFARILTSTADELFGGDGELALAAFFVAGRCAQLERPVRPHEWFVFFFGGLGHHLELPNVCPGRFSKRHNNNRMPTERFDLRRADFLKAVTRLEEACAQPQSSFIRDSVIQRFEFSWELAWKMLKLRLSFLGIEALNPREVIRHSLQTGLIQDGNAWTEAQHQRNMTSHTYDEALSVEVDAFIRSQGVALLRNLANAASAWSEA